MNAARKRRLRDGMLVLVRFDSSVERSRKRLPLGREAQPQPVIGGALKTRTSAIPAPAGSFTSNLPVVPELANQPMNDRQLAAFVTRFRSVANAPKSVIPLDFIRTASIGAAREAPP